jgi:nucleotidyltransferase/DNA polymerase involved in DNA repair
MAKKKKPKKSGHARAKKESSLQEILSLSAKLADLQKDMTKAAQVGGAAEERLADLEVHVNLLARLLTTLCIEKLGIRVGALKRLVRRIEKEAVRDSQIMELESLYKLSGGNAKRTPSPHVRPKGDPWDQIS